MKDLSKSKKIGNLGENLATRYFEDRGYKVFTRNYWKPWGEIDIVLQKSAITYFIEVKAVSRENFELGMDGYRPEDNMHPWKLKRLSRIVQSFVAEYDIKDWQFDLVTVLIDQKGKRAKIERVENVLLG